MKRLLFKSFSLRGYVPRVVAVICVLFLAGCRDRVGAPVNVNLAQSTLTSAMEAWKEGKTPKVLFEKTPSVFVQEAEWNDGATLVDYEIISNDQPYGPNLVATVKLKLSKGGGKVTEKVATYIVTTSPSLTVYRNPMR